VITPSELMQYGEVVYWSGKRTDTQVIDLAMARDGEPARERLPRIAKQQYASNEPPAPAGGRPRNARIARCPRRRSLRAARTERRRIGWRPLPEPEPAPDPNRDDSDSRIEQCHRAWARRRTRIQRRLPSESVEPRRRGENGTSSGSGSRSARVATSRCVLV
jgi:hypothetical protein